MDAETVAFDASATVSASVSQSETPVKASERVSSPLNHLPTRRFSEKVKGEGGFAKCGLGNCLVVGLSGCGSHRLQMKSRSEQVTDSVVNRHRNVETDLQLARLQVEQFDEHVEEVITRRP